MSTTRRGFLKTLGLGCLTAPVIAKAMQAPVAVPVVKSGRRGNPEERKTIEINGVTYYLSAPLRYPAD